ncbi:MAG: hypothetical protein RQ875_10210 [Vicingaceae bacterium]|nr:hypothetical protein [Vicingaceae bacterium]
MRTLCMYIILLLCLSSCKPSFNLTDQSFKHGAEYTVPINLSNISSRFDSDFYHKNKDIIDSIINFTNLNTNHVIEIGVYTTYLGQEEYNLKLSLAQAKGFIFILKSNGARHENLIL